MDWFGTGLQILLAGLTIWKDERASEFTREVIKLKTIISEERAKPIYKPGLKNGTFRNDVVIDHAERRLRIIADTFSSSVARDSIPKVVS